MKTTLHPFLPWLAAAALAEWLIARTLARAAIFMPKTSAMVSVYKAMGVSGQIATSLASLLALAALGWIAWQGVRRHRNLVIAAACVALLLVNLLALFTPSTGWLALSFQAFLCTGIVVLMAQAWMQSLRIDLKIAITCIGMTLLVGRLYQSLDVVYSILHLPGPPAWSGLIFNAGELLVMISVISLWWSFGRKARWSTWLIAAVPAMLFAIPRLLAPAMTGIMTIWSTGLTLYLPWPAYVLALWLAGVTVINALRKGYAAGWATLLLVAGGYAPQMSIQAFLGLIALWILLNSSNSDPAAGSSVSSPSTAPVLASR